VGSRKAEDHGKFLKCNITKNEITGRRGETGNVYEILYVIKSSPSGSRA